ncbi:hypothetical protein DEO72_LG5g1791 [Vigna unguiculata]|uniref:Uncharacterized protein n=1 Tax=Vigna unguiculata TaxID=3917 RepID=A0A4D6LY92_VIGUN|nr:hypothetical protein DEO72_LG5g1791 [Vigna unguiculata]
MTNSLHVNKSEGTHPWISLGFPVVLPHIESDQPTDLEGVIKKIKVKVREVNNLTRGERIIVDFDELGMEIGEGQGVLAGYCGTLAIDCNLFPINFERWSGKIGMPDTYFLECFKEILQEVGCT